MKEIEENHEYLRNLGLRLRAARLDRNETMAVFADRLGVSESTIRAMERGIPTVQIGIWLNALWVLDRLSEIGHVLERRDSLLDRARNARQSQRRRASKRPT